MQHKTTKTLAAAVLALMLSTSAYAFEKPVLFQDQGSFFAGDCTVVHLPEIGVTGNTHFPFSDLNNVQIADLMQNWLHEKGLDK